MCHLTRAVQESGVTLSVAAYSYALIAYKVLWHILSGGRLHIGSGYILFSTNKIIRKRKHNTRINIQSSNESVRAVRYHTFIVIDHISECYEMSLLRCNTVCGKSCFLNTSVIIRPDLPEAMKILYWASTALCCRWTRLCNSHQLDE